MEGNSAQFNFSKRAWSFGLASALLHLLFLLFKAPSFDVATALKRERPTKLLIKLAKESDPKKIKQVVETQDSEQKLRPPNKAFLGKKNNTFARETKAAKNGSFKAAAKGDKNGHKKLAQEIEKALRNPKLKKLKFSDLAAQSSLKPKALKKSKTVSRSSKLGLSNGKDKKAGLSRSNDYLEEVPLGDFTRLNTQEFEFYGFYHRIREKLEQFWGANLQEQMQKIYQSGRSIASGQNLLTSLVIKMNNKGEIIHIQLGSTSGIKELDDVAIDSFNQAGPFPNPPQGMLKDGVATIKWGFAVQSN